MAGHFFQKRQEPTTTRSERKERALETLTWLLLLLGSAGKSSSHDRYGPAAAHLSPSVHPRAARLSAAKTKRVKASLLM